MNTPRVAIYARFSSDRQDERSIADQVALCRDYAARHGWQVAGIYSDHAISGASIHGRGEYQRLLADAEARRFDLILAEDVDRYARNAADAMRFQQLAEFAGVRIYTVADGEANELLFGFKGLMSALWLKTHALKTRRGQEGRVRAGLVPGGRAYGYAPVPGKPGERTIIEAEAETVRRIYREFAAGRTPRDIAHDLNRDRVPPPRGDRWNASALNGGKARGTGILANALYRGVIKFNRVRMVKDPATGKRISRINAGDAIREAAAPALAIVPAELAAAVDARLAERARMHKPHEARRARHLFSGLLRCAACAGGLITSGVDKSGRKRLRCSRDHESGTCPAPATFYLDTVERLAIGRLRAEFRHPDVIAEYVREYHAERERLAGTQRQRRDVLEKRLGQLEREAARVVDLLVQSVGDATALGDRSKALAAEREALRAELAGLEDAPNVIALHPAVLARFEQCCRRLLAHDLGQAAVAGDPEAAAAIRDLVEAVTVRRDATRPEGLAIEITGRLAALVGAPQPGVWGIAVAGGRYRHSPHPLRFRLAG